MSLVPTRSLVTAPVAAFNVITLEHAEAIVAAAQRTSRPVILAISENAVRYHGALGPLAAAVAAVARDAEVPCALHLDHVESTSLLHAAPRHGFGSIMIDASRLPYAENVARTARAVAFAHRHGLWVEAELGAIGGKDGAPPPHPHDPGARTDPAEAAAFVHDTGVDALAVAVGSSHAMTQRSAQLDLALVAALHAAVPVPLVLHGSSGVPDDLLRQAVAAGITKVNIGTALNIAFTTPVRRVLATSPALVDPRGYLSPAREQMADIVAHLLDVVSPEPR